MAQYKVIFDTDPGVDDAMAILMMAGHPDIDILGFTTTFGNVSVKTATKNARYLSQMIAPFVGKNIPVYKGVCKPFMYETTEGYAEFVHGDGGMGGLFVPEVDTPYETISGAEYIIESVRQSPHQISLIAVGPLGNIALAMMLEPNLPKLCKNIFIMGGSFFRQGNISPSAEANIYNDPHAADMVFGGDWHESSAIAGLDITYSAPMHRTWIEDLSTANPMAKWMAECADFYMKIYEQGLGVDGVFCHDAIAVAMMTNPEMFECVQGTIRVATDDMSRGNTIMRLNDTVPNAYWQNRTPMQAGVKIDADGFLSLYADCIKRLT